MSQPPPTVENPRTFSIAAPGTGATQTDAALAGGANVPRKTPTRANCISSKRDAAHSVHNGDWSCSCRLIAALPSAKPECYLAYSGDAFCNCVSHGRTAGGRSFATFLYSLKKCFATAKLKIFHSHTAVPWHRPGPKERQK